MKSDPKSNKTHFTAEELAEFDALVVKKIEIARKELRFIQRSLTQEVGDVATRPAKSNTMEDSVNAMEKEKFSQLAIRQQRFIQQLENARIRIQNGTYGRCVETGKLIDKERLLAVPHTTHSIEAKLKKT